mmetsp:Transcript_44304/g.128100  ORF Transcript_44304/g.128100 Transcript_44304/m.128100 type:complete len:282 (-) Transcript_44304:118-963(-)
MGNAVAAVAFMPPTRSEGELGGLRQEPRFLLIRGGKRPHRVAALHVDRGAPVTILYSHANAEDLLDVQETLHRLSVELNVNVLGYDYHGYGLSGGSCSEAGCCDAARACYEYLLEQGAERSNIVLMGRSLGTGPTVDLAAREPGVAGVVLQSPLLSVLRTRLSEGLANAMEGADLFDNGSKISSVACPVFVVHGSDDRVVPREHGEELARRAPNAVRPWWAEGCGHNDVSGHQDYVGKLADFLQFVRARQKRQWEETVASFAPSMMIRRRESTTKIVLNAL